MTENGHIRRSAALFAAVLLLAALFCTGSAVFADTESETAAPAATAAAGSATWHIQNNPPESATVPALSPPAVTVTDTTAAATSADPIVSGRSREQDVTVVTDAVTTAAQSASTAETAAVITSAGLAAIGVILSLFALLAIVFTLMFNK